MRRAVVLSLLLFAAFPAAASALRLTPGDGTLAVRNGDGMLAVSLTRGAVIGKIGQGVLRVEIGRSASCDDLAVFGAERERPVTTRGGDTLCLFSGRDIRFRLIDADTRFSIGTFTSPARSFSLSMVARASVSIRGAGGLNDGTYSVNGDDYVSLPDDGRRFFVGVQPVQPFLP